MPGSGWTFRSGAALRCCSSWEQDRSKQHHSTAKTKVFCLSVGNAPGQATALHSQVSWGASWTRIGYYTWIHVCIENQNKGQCWIWQCSDQVDSRAAATAGAQNCLCWYTLRLWHPVLLSQAGMAGAVPGTHTPWSTHCFMLAWTSCHPNLVRGPFFQPMWSDYPLLASFLSLC